MKKIIFGIFAHPDDEAFGPVGTLIQEARAGTDLHLIMLTAGEAGTNPDNVPDLGSVRLEEWKKAGALIGAKSMEFLGYEDGKLNNGSMIEIGKRLADYMRTVLEDAPADVTVECISLDLNGYTGHIDHIVAARATCYAFYTLKAADSRLSRIRLACLPAELLPSENTDWIYMESGRLPNEVDEIVDARDLHGDIIKVMQVHRSQRGDYEFTLRLKGEDLGRDYFIVKS